MKIFDRWSKPFYTKFSLAIFITVALMIEVLLGIQYWYAEKHIRVEMEQRAES